MALSALLAAGLPESARGDEEQGAPNASGSGSLPYVSAAGETALLWRSGLLGTAPAWPALTLSSQPSSPSVDDDIRINRPGEGEAAPNCNTQNEVSLARFGDNLIAGWVDGGQCDRLSASRPGVRPLGAISLSGYGYSSDGGKTWTDGGVLTPPDGGHLFGDPVLAAGPDGTFYYGSLLLEDLAPLETLSKIGVARSTDGGRTWSTPVNASLNASPDRDPAYFQDKPWIAVDNTDSPYRGSVYVAWSELLTNSTDPLDHAVLFSRSIDGGLSFGAPVKLSVPDSLVSAGIGTQVAVGPQGEIYVAWIQPRAELPIWLARSLDGGLSFSPPRLIGSATGIGNNQVCLPGGTRRFVLNGDIRVENWPSMALDISGSSDPDSPDYNPYRGRIYVAVPTDFVPGFVTQPLGDESDIAFIYSFDGGATWKNEDGIRARVILNDDGTETDQFHPQVAVDSEGRVAVSWYDRRLSDESTPDNWEMAVFATVSTDGGETFGPNFQVSDVPFPPSRTNPNTNLLAGCYMGEYNAMTGGDGEFLLAWGDNRDGPPGFPDPNVYFDRISLPDEAPSDPPPADR